MDVTRSLLELKPKQGTVPDRGTHNDDHDDHDDDDNDDRLTTITN